MLNSWIQAMPPTNETYSPIARSKGPGRRTASGLLIAEAVVASFIMIFAFIAAARLFDASLKWEAEATALRAAAIVAEKRMEQLRGWSEATFATNPFDSAALWTAEIGAPTAAPTPDPEVPTVLIKVRAGEPTYLAAHAFRPAGPGNPPPDGFYSPTSHFYSPYPVGTINFQRHPEWVTYPYVRNMSASCRKVEVTAFYGNSGANEYRLVSYISDPLAPTSASPAVNVSGPANINAGGTATYTVNFRGTGGYDIPDVTALWSVEGENSGVTIIRPQDAKATSVEVTILNSALPSSNLRLIAKMRYRGEELVGLSPEITITP